MKKYEVFGHTADIGLRAYGEDLEDLFKNAAQGLFSIITDSRPAGDSEEKIILEAETLEDLLVSWLSELVSLFFTYKFLPREYNITIEDKQEPKRLWARVKGLGSYEDKINTEIKAATYHNLKIKKIDSGFKAEIIFDV